LHAVSTLFSDRRYLVPVRRYSPSSREVRNLAKILMFLGRQIFWRRDPQISDYRPLYFINYSHHRTCGKVPELPGGHKIWEKRERGRIQGLPKFLEHPLLSQERVKLRTSNLAAAFRHYPSTALVLLWSSVLCRHRSRPLPSSPPQSPGLYSGSSQRLATKNWKTEANLAENG